VPAIHKDRYWEAPGPDQLLVPRLITLESALHAEAHAWLAATDGAASLGANQEIFESDSATLVHALNSRDYDLARFGVLIREARSSAIYAKL
jgi:hypothetical protein